jgi:hypothetical protein
MNELTQEDIDALNKLIATGLDFRIEHEGGRGWAAKLWRGPIASCPWALAVDVSLARAINMALIVSEV